VCCFFFCGVVAQFHPRASRWRCPTCHEQGILFEQLCNVLDPGIAVALVSVSNELRTATRAPLQHS